MSDIQWNPEDKDFNAPIERTGPKSPKMVQWVMKTGLVKDETQANYVLLGISVVFLIMTAVVMFDMKGPSASSGGVTYREDLSPEELEGIPPEILNSLPSRNE